MQRIAVLGAVALITMASVTPSDAQQVRAGTLECRGGATTSYFVGSVTDLNCTFRPTVGRPHNYRAAIRRFGVDLGFTRETAIAWLVFAPTQRVGRGELAGSYAGVSAGATLGVGLGANALVGGSNNSFALQPLSVQSQTGLNVAAGISRLELVAEGPRPRSRRKRR
jgi:hypothetical protein